MIEFLFTIILTGHLSYAPRSLFDTVALNRQNNLTSQPITRDFEQYDCLLGVPVNYEYLIDSEAHFLSSEGELFGPYLIVDVQNKSARDMQLDGLVADITCQELVHKEGSLIIQYRN